MTGAVLTIREIGQGCFPGTIRCGGCGGDTLCFWTPRLGASCQLCGRCFTVLPGAPPLALKAGEHLLKEGPPVQNLLWQKDYRRAKLGLRQRSDPDVEEEAAAAGLRAQAVGDADAAEL